VPQVIAGLILAAAAAAVARLGGLLTIGGALTAVVIGTAVFAGGGWGLALTLFAAFWLTGVVTVYRRGEKIQPEHRRGRSASQVLANGLIPAGLAVAYVAFDLPWAITGAMGAIAASAADTLATEIGLLSPSLPRLITTGQRVARERSGGITAVGTISGVGGAIFVGLFGLEQGWAPVAVGGIAGMVIDSLLGATAQARYRCPSCGEEGESRECACGGARMPAGGIAWMTNDAVNLLMAAAGAAVAALLAS